MSERTMKKQRGLTLMGLLAACVAIAMVAVLGIKVFPDVQEYLAALKSAKAVVADPASKGASVADIRHSFDKRISIDNVKAVHGADLDITKEGNDIVIAFAYTTKIPLYGPVSLTIDFEGSTAQ